IVKNWKLQELPIWWTRHWMWPICFWKNKNRAHRSRENGSFFHGMKHLPGEYIDTNVIPMDEKEIQP
ncbi:MAG: hypothetical protein IKT25_04760, partial [Firmicutes bacterium]|nr:hypothetical protein [Bacillota bacterium]